MSKLSKKILKLRKKGLKSYGKYLEEQLVFSGKKKIRKKYKSYIEKEIAKNKKAIKKVNAKLK